MEYSSIEEIKVLIHVTMWLNTENIVLSERNNMPQNIYYITACVLSD